MSKTFDATAENCSLCKRLAEKVRELEESVEVELKANSEALDRENELCEKVRELEGFIDHLAAEIYDITEGKIAHDGGYLNTDQVIEIQRKIYEKEAGD